MANSFLSNNVSKGFSGLLLASVSKFSDKIFDKIGDDLVKNMGESEFGKMLKKEAGIVIPFAGVAITLLEHVAGHFLTDSIKNFEFKNNDPDKINHDIQKLLEKSILKALGNTKFVLSEAFYEKNAELIKGPLDAIKSESIRFVKLTKNKESLLVVSQDLYSDFKKHQGIKFELPTFAKEMKEGVSNEKLNLHPESFQDQAKRFFLEKISDKTHNCTKEDLNRYTDYLTDQIMICFGDGLKHDENKLAWAAYQKMILDNLNVGVTKILEGQNRIESKINELGVPTQNVLNISLDASQKLELSEAISKMNDPKIFETAFRSAIDEVFDSINDKLGNIEIIVTDINASVKHVERDMGEMKGWVARNQVLIFAISFLTMAGIIIYMLYLNQKPQEIKISLKESDFHQATIDQVNTNASQVSAKPIKPQSLTSQASTVITTPNTVVTPKVTARTKPVCEIDGLTFVDDKSMTNKISFSQNANGTYGFNGYLDIQGVEGNIVADNTTLKIINGDVTGSLMLNAQCSKITGVLKLKSNGAAIQVSYRKE